MSIKIWITYENEDNKHVDTYTIREPPKGYETLGEYLTDILWDGLDRLDDEHFWKIDRIKVTLKERNIKMSFEAERTETISELMEVLEEMLRRVFSGKINDVKEVSEE